MAKITMFGLEQRMRSKNKSLFDLATMPQGYNADTLKDTIISRCGELEVLYSDAYYMQYEIGVWFDRWKESFERWWELRHLDYNPIENYDRYEEINSSGRTEAQGNQSGSGTSNASDTAQNYVSAYDSSSLTTDGQTTNTASGRSTTASESSSSGTNSQNSTSHVHGNIGVTTNAQMIQQELKLAEDNLYDMVADLFSKEFVLLIY